MPQLNSSALGVLSDSTVNSLHGSVLSNDSISPNLSCESESVQNTSNLSLRQLDNLSFLERVKAVSNEPDLSGIFSRGSLDDMRLKKKKRKPLETKLNSNDSLKSTDSSSSSINISNLDDSFFKKPNIPCPKSKRKRENSRSKDSLHSLDKPLDLEKNIKPPRRITKGNKENHSSRKISVNLASDSSLDSTNESLENTVNEINPSSLESLPNKNLKKKWNVTISDEKDLSSDISQDISKIDFELHPSSNELEFTSIGEVPQLNQLQNKNLSRRVSLKLANLLDDSEIEEENSINTSEKSITSSVVSISLAESDSINLDESVHDEVKVNNQNILKAKRISVNFPLDDSVVENVASKVNQSSNEIQGFETNSLNDNVPEKPFENLNSVSKCEISENNYGKFSEILDQKSKPRKSALKSNIISSSSDNSDFNNDQKMPALRRSSRKSVRFSLDTRSKSSEASNNDADKYSKGPLAQIEISGSVNSHLNIQNSNKDKKNVPMIVERLSDLDNSSLSINISDISGLAAENLSKISALSFDNSNETSTNIQEVNDITHKKYSSDKLSKGFNDAVMNEKKYTDQASAKELKSDKTLLNKSLGENISNISDLTMSDTSLGLTEENSHISRDFGKDNSTISSLSLLSDEGLDTDPKVSRRRISSLSNISLLSDETCAPEEGHNSGQNSTLNSVKSRRVSIGNIQDSNKKNSESIHIPLQPEGNLNTVPLVCEGEGNTESVLKNLRKKSSSCSNLTLSSETLTLNVDEVIDGSYITNTSSKSKIKSRRVSAQCNLDDSDQQAEKTKIFHYNHHTENSGKASSPSSTNDLKNRLSVISDHTLLSKETLNLSIDPVSLVDDKNYNNETSVLEIKSKRDSLNFNLEGSFNVENKTSMTDELHDNSDCLVGYGELGRTLKKDGKERVSAISNLSLLSNETFNLSEDPIYDDKTNPCNMSSHITMKSKRVSVCINSEDTADESCIQEEEKELSQSVPSKQCLLVGVQENICRDNSVGSVETGSPCLVGLNASSQTCQLQKGRVSAISNLTLLTNETLNLSLDPDSDDTNHRSKASNVKMKSKRISVHFNLEDTADEESVPEDEKENTKQLPEEHQPEENLCGDCSVISGKSVRSSLGPKGRASAISNFTLLSNETVDFSEEPTSDDETNQSSKTLNANVKTKRVSVHFNLEDTANEDYDLEEEKENAKQLPSRKSGRSSLGPNGRSSTISNLTLLSNEALNLSEDITYEDETNHSSNTSNTKVNAKRVSVHFNLEDTADVESLLDTGKENSKILPKEHDDPEENNCGTPLVALGKSGRPSLRKESKERGSATSNLTLISNETLNLSEDSTSDDEKNHSSETSKANVNAKGVSVHLITGVTANEESLQNQFENGSVGSGKTQSPSSLIGPEGKIFGSCLEASSQSSQLQKERVSAISNLTLLTNETLNLSLDPDYDDDTNISSNVKMKSKRISVHFNLEDTADEESVPEDEKENTKRLPEEHQREENLFGDSSVISGKSVRSSLGPNGRASVVSNLTLLTNETLNLSEDPADDKINCSSKTSNAKRVSVHFNLEDTYDAESLLDEGKENNKTLPEEPQPEDKLYGDCSVSSGLPGRSLFTKERISTISNLTLVSNETLNLNDDTTYEDETNHSSKISNTKVYSKRVSVHLNLDQTVEEKDVQDDKKENTELLAKKQQPGENLNGDCSGQSHSSTTILKDNMSGSCLVGGEAISQSSQSQKDRVSGISNLSLLTNETLNLSTDQCSDHDKSCNSKASNTNLRTARVSVQFNLEHTADEESIQQVDEGNTELLLEHQREGNTCPAPSEGSGKSGRSSFTYLPKERASAISNLTLLSNETLNLSEDPTSDDVTNKSSKTSIANVKTKRVSVHFNLEDTADEEPVPEEELEITKTLSEEQQPEDLCGAAPVEYAISNRSSLKKGPNERASTISNLTLLSNETLNLYEGPTSDDETSHDSKISNANKIAKRVSIPFNFDQTVDEGPIQEDKKENAESLSKEQQPEENLFGDGSVGSGDGSSSSNDLEVSSAVSHLSLPNRALNLSLDHNCESYTNLSSGTSNDKMYSNRASVNCNVVDPIKNEEIETNPSMYSKLQPEKNVSKACLVDSEASSSSTQALKGRRDSVFSNANLLTNETLNLIEDPESDYDTKLNECANTVSVPFNFDGTIHEEGNKNNPLIPSKHKSYQNLSEAPSVGSVESDISTSKKYPHCRVSAITNRTLQPCETLKLSEDLTYYDVTNHSSKTSNVIMNAKRVSVVFNAEHMSNEESIQKDGQENTELLPEVHQQEENLFGERSDGSGDSKTSLMKIVPKGRVSAISNLTLLSNETLTLSEDPVSDDETNHNSRSSSDNMKMKRVSVHFNPEDTSDGESLHEDGKENTKKLLEKHQAEEIVSDVPSDGSEMSGRSSTKKGLKGRSSVISNLTLLSNETLNLSEKSDDETNHSSSTSNTKVNTKRVSVHFNFDDTAGDVSIQEGKENFNLVSDDDQVQNNPSGDVLVNLEEASSSTKDLKGRVSGACLIHVEANSKSSQALKERVSTISNFTLLTNETLNLSEDPESDCDTNYSNRIPNSKTQSERSKTKQSIASISIGYSDANVGSHGKINDSDKCLPNDLQLKEVNNMPLECTEKPFLQKPRKSILRRSTRISSVINHPEDANFITHESPKIINGNAKTQKPLRKSVTFSTDVTIKSNFNKEHIEQNNIDELEENEYLMNKGLVNDQSVKNIAGVDNLTSDMRPSNVDGASLDKNIKLTNGGIDSGLDKTYFVENDCMELTMMRKSFPLDSENITNRTNYKSLFMEEDLSLANANVNETRTLAGMDFTLVNTDNLPSEEALNEEMSLATTINRVDLPRSTMEITGVDSTSMPRNVNNIQDFSNGSEINRVCRSEQDITVTQGNHKEKTLFESHLKRNSNHVDKMTDGCSEANRVTDSPINDNSLNIEDVKIKHKKTKCSHVSKNKSKKAFDEDLNDMSISQVSDMELTAYSCEKTMEQTTENSKVYESYCSNLSFDEDISSSTLIERSKTFSSISIKRCNKDKDIIEKGALCGDQSNNEKNLNVNKSSLESTDFKSGVRESKNENSAAKIKSQDINEVNIPNKAIADKSINHSAVGRRPSFNEINMVGAKKRISTFSEKYSGNNNTENTSDRISSHSSENADHAKGSETSRTEREVINADIRNLVKCTEENRKTKGENITFNSSLNGMSFSNSSSDESYPGMGWTSDGKSGSLESNKEIEVPIVENAITNNSSVNLSLIEGELNSDVSNEGMPTPKKISVHLCKSDLSNSSFIPTLQNETSQTASSISNKVTNDSNVKFTSTKSSLNSKENCKKKRKVSILFDSTTNESTISTNTYNSKPSTRNISETHVSEFDNESEIMDKQRPLLASTLNATLEKTEKHKVSVHFDLNSISKLSSVSNPLPDCFSMNSNNECLPNITKDNIQKTFDRDSEGLLKSTESVMASNFLLNSSKQILKKNENVNKHVSVLLEDSSSQSTIVDCKLSTRTLKDTLCEEKNSFSNAYENDFKKGVELFIDNDTGTCDDVNVNRQVSVVLEDTSSQPTFADPSKSSARAQRNTLSELELSLNNKAEFNHHVSVGITLDKTSIQPTFSDITEFDDQKILDDQPSLKKLSENMSLPNTVSDLPTQNLGKEINVNRHVSVALDDTTNQMNLPDSKASTGSIEDTIVKGKKTLDIGDENKCKEDEELYTASLNTVIIDKDKNNRHVSVGITLDNMSTHQTISNLTEFDESEPLTNSTNSKNFGKKHVCVSLEDSPTISNIVDKHITGIRTSKEKLNEEGNKSLSIAQENKINEFVATSISSNTKTLSKNLGSNEHDTVELPLDNTSVKLTISDLNEFADHRSCSENVIIESTHHFSGDGSPKKHVSVALDDTCIQQTNNFENIRDNTKCPSLQHIGERPSSIIESVPLMPSPFISDALDSGDISKEIDPTDLDTSKCVSLFIDDFSGRVEQQRTCTSINGDNSSASDKTNKTKGNRLSSRNPISTRKKSNSLETSAQRLTRNSLKKKNFNLSIKSPNSSNKKQNDSSSKKGSDDYSQKSPKILADCVIISDIEELIPNVPNINNSDDIAEPKALPCISSSCINSPNSEGVSLSGVSPQPNKSNLELNITLDHSIRDSLLEALSDSNKKEICKRKSPRITISSPNSDETKGKKPYSLRKSSPNHTQNVSLMTQRKSVTFGQITNKNISSVKVSSDANIKAKKRKSKSDDTKTGKEIDEHVFIRPDLPVRKSGSLSITKRDSNCLEDDISNEDCSGASKRKKNSDKTINELSYDTSLDMSEIPRDERLLHKKLIYHSTPINPVLERRRKKKFNKKSKKSEFTEGHSDKMIQVSKGFGMSSDIGISKVQAPTCHSQVGNKSSELSNQNQRDIKRKEISPENISSKRRKCAEEDKIYKVFSSGSGEYSSRLAETISATSPPLPRHHVQFRQNVQFKGISSEYSSRIERNQSYPSGCSGRSYLSNSFYSTLSQSNTSLSCYDISKKVKFNENVSYPTDPSVSANGSSNSQYKVMISRLTQGSDRSKLTSTRNEEESEMQGAQNVSVAVSELPSLSSECLSKRLLIGSNFFPSQRRKPKLRNAETSVMPLFRKGNAPKYDFKNDRRFNINNEPFKRPRIKFPAKWVSNELFKYLKGKLENSLKEEAPDMALRIISLLCAAEASIQCLNNHDEIDLCTLVLRKFLVKYNICPTQLEFGLFLINYTPFSFYKKLTKSIILKNPKVSDSIVHEGETIDIEF